MTSPAAARGARLEHAIAGYFAHHGYTVRTNLVLTGRSGARHEIDVFAEKSDPLTTFRLAIECKAWAQPIEKDVVTKLHYVMSELGLHKGIVVSMAGARSGAAAAAGELGIELWGPDELRRHLGDAVFTDVAGVLSMAIGAGETGLGYPFRVAPDGAQQTIRSVGKGRFGIRTLEETVWFAPMWVPAYLTNLTVTQPNPGKFRSKVASRAVVNIYDALAGYLLPPPTSPPVQISMAGTRALKPLRRDTQIRNTLLKALETRAKVSTPSAVARHEQTLQQLGVPTPCLSMSIDQTTTIFLPVYAGMLRTSAGDRLVALDATTGVVSEPLTQLLTAHISHVRAAFG